MNTDNLIELRKLLELSQEDMATIIGVSRSTYTCYERNTRIIPIEKLNIISNTYDKSLNFLTGLSKEDSIKINHNNINKKKIGKILREVRIKMKLTQEELAQKIYSSQSSVSEYESGLKITTLLLIDYAKATGESIDYLCDKTDE